MRPYLLLLAPPLLLAQMDIREYDPKTSLVVPQHQVTRAKYPFIDVHHHPRVRTPADVDQLIKDMDGINLRTLVNLSGGTGDRLKSNVILLKERYPDRFAVFANWDYNNVDDPGYGHRIAQQLEQDFQNGARGLKIFKQFGMDAKDSKGQRIHVDDARYDEIFETCGKLKIPVLIHTAEPQPFFDPIDKKNERWRELQEFPGRARPADKYPSWKTLMDEQHRMFERHPRTTFINAHLGWLGNDLAELGRLMDRLPNMYTEIGAVLYELGRQPRTAREFLIKYQDRVMFGKDAWDPRDPNEYWCYFRVLESPDEYFDYYRPRHAFWKMYGLELPDEVLKKLYYKNALKVIPGLNAAQFPK
ncbi:MAG TPA: amidohydrolase family protein [Bryobacteraceae bacterium]|nr:amidohydrolase family protein [Bryobacteraceae bacterium]